eukprot:7569675-Pyramimonas_sp.AAC.1
MITVARGSRGLADGAEGLRRIVKPLGPERPWSPRGRENPRDFGTPLARIAGSGGRGRRLEQNSEPIGP